MIHLPLHFLPTTLSRYEKLQRWDDALRAYQRRLEATTPGSVSHVEALLGQCRCLAALAEWSKLFEVRGLESVLCFFWLACML